MATRSTGDEKKNENVEKRRQAQIVKALLEKMEKQLGKEGVKATFGDYIKLVQLRKELEDEEPKEIRVTWVDPEEAKDSKE